MQKEIIEIPEDVKQELDNITTYIKAAKQILIKHLNVKFNMELARVETRLDAGLDKLEALSKRCVIS